LVVQKSPYFVNKALWKHKGIFIVVLYSMEYYFNCLEIEYDNGYLGQWYIDNHTIIHATAL